jgi:Zn-dependent protease with chaperone function
MSGSTTTTVVPALTFSGTIAPTRLSPAYRLGLVVVACTMLLLPLLYLGLVGAAAAAVWWHVTENTWIFNGSRGQWRLIAYLTPAVAGVVLVFFMVKPILARPSRHQDPLPVDPAAEPALFKLIEEICRQVRAPRPQRVQVDCTVNASAGLLHGPWAIFRRDLVLTIGLPLVAGLSVRELAGVLAHEFGHFAQGGGLRLTGIVRGVNGWFGRVVYERDAWDEKLDRWSKESDWRLQIILMCARGGVWVSRRILYGLMMGGHAISCFMMRQMEYDADSYEVKIAGTDAFKRTSGRMRELGMAARFAYNDLRDTLGGGSAPASMPAFMVQRAQHLPPDLLDRVRGTGDEKTGVFDTHPCDADRIRAAEAARADGVLMNADVPATILFNDFEGLSAAATRHHFEHDLGLSVAELTFVDTSVALQQSRTRAEGFQAMSRFFANRWTVFRPLHLRLEEPQLLDPAALAARLAAAQTRMEQLAPGVSDRHDEFDALEAKLQNAFAAAELLSSGFPGVKAEDFELEAGTAAAAAEAQGRASSQQAAMEPSLAAFDVAAAERLGCALSLLRDPAAHPDVPFSEAAALVQTLNALAVAIPHVRELRRLEMAAILIDANMTSSPKPDDTQAYLRQLERRLMACRDRVRLALANSACPSGLAASPMTLAERCGMPAGGPFETATEITDRVFKLYAEVLGRLVTMATRAEERLA